MSLEGVGNSVSRGMIAARKSTKPGLYGPLIFYLGLKLFVISGGVWFFIYKHASLKALGSMLEGESITAFIIFPFSKRWTDAL